MSEPVGIGFVGAGAVAEMHEQALRDIPGARLIGIYRRNRAELHARAARWNCAPFERLEDLLADPRIGAVFILSPLEDHHDQAMQALAAGKHVLIEKPVSTSAASVRQIAAEAARRNLVCMPAHNYIYQPDLWRAKRLIQNGALGRIVAGWVNFILFHDEELASHYPGVMRQIMTHHLYCTLYLLGRPRRVVALTSCLHYQKLDREDQVAMALEMESGALVNLFASFACNDETSQPWSFNIKVLGTNGGVHYNWRDAVFFRKLGTLPWAFVPYEESYTHEDRFFIERCLARGEAPLSSMEDAAVAQEIIEAAEESVRSGRVMRFGS